MEGKPTEKLHLMCYSERHHGAVHQTYQLICIHRIYGEVLCYTLLKTAMEIECSISRQQNHAQNYTG